MVVPCRGVEILLCVLSRARIGKGGFSVFGDNEASNVVMVMRLVVATCFTNEVYQNDERHEFTVNGLYNLLVGRKNDLPEGSYTTYLFQKGTDKILKKVGEECTEVIIAGKADDKKETIYEIADLAYHTMVLMVQMGISVEDIQRELASRHIIDHKVKQEKMTK